MVMAMAMVMVMMMMRAHRRPGCFGLVCFGVGDMTVVYIYILCFF